MISESDLAIIREKLSTSVRPLFFFDDDPDGVSSFLLFYKAVNEGKGICVKGKPILEKRYADKVTEYSPDRVFVLDKPLIEQEFLDKISQEIIWLDHHPVQDNKGVLYFNPRKRDDEDNRPTSYWAYLVTKDMVKNALWIAMVGIIGDWNLLLADEFRAQYPDLLPADIDTPEKALFETKIGKLVRIVDFNLKGATSEVMKSVKALTRIKDPNEILNQTTPRGKFIYKKYLTINKDYQQLLKEVEVTDDKILIFRYENNKLALSSQLSNELLYLYPEKIIIVVREKADDTMMSIRSSKYKIIDNLKKALESTTGYGGGHDHACGASVKKSEFDIFLEKFRETFNS